jgi:hypothetical protein
MFLWFASLSSIIVLLVFSSAAVDHRFVMAGAVLPVFEVVVRGPWLAHTLVGAVAVLVVVVVATRGQRLRARQLVGLPIGMGLHLVLDGSWTNAKLFWWPVLGGSPLGSSRVPEFEHLGLSLVLEVVGLAATVWLVRRGGLTDPATRARFWRTGRIVLAGAA